MRFWEGIEKPYLAVAPMVGNSEEAWRRLARNHGANVFYTEMVNCETFLRGNRNPVKNFWYTTSADDRPLIIQICGDCPRMMLEAALILQDHCDAIDINFGCPQSVARKGHYGAYLQDEWDLVAEIVKTLSAGLHIPVVCKIRVFESVERTVEYARVIEDAGCAMLAVHGRTREQRGINMGFASWDHIRAVKKSLRIPILSNGNIMEHADIRRCLEYTGCDGVMVGETHLYNPLVFTGERRTCLEVIGEYFDICRGHVGIAEYKHVKSHVFKLLYAYFTKHPSKRSVLESCDTIDKIHSFYLDLLDEMKSGRESPEAYIMAPRLIPVADEGARHTGE